MWQVNAEAKEPGQPGRTKISCRKISEGEPFSLIRTTIDFSADCVAFSTDDMAPEQSGVSSKVRTAVIAWAKNRGALPFSKQNVKDAVSGRTCDKSTCVDALLQGGVFVQVGRRCGAPEMLHADHTPRPIPGMGPGE